MMEKEIETRRMRMQELNSQAQDLVDAGHFDPNAVEESRIVMEERFVPTVKSFFFLVTFRHYYLVAPPGLIECYRKSPLI